VGELHAKGPEEEKQRVSSMSISSMLNEDAPSASGIEEEEGVLEISKSAIGQQAPGPFFLLSDFLLHARLQHSIVLINNPLCCLC